MAGQPFNINHNTGSLLLLPNLKAGHLFTIVVLPERKASLSCQQVIKAILQCVPFRKLPSHPPRTSAMRDDGSHPSHVGDRMPVRQFAKPLQLGHQLENNFLLDVVGFSSLSLTISVKTEFEPNNAFDNGLGMD